MRLFKGDKVYDFMAVRKYWIALSLSLTFFSLFLIAPHDTGLTLEQRTDYHINEKITSDRARG